MSATTIKVSVSTATVVKIVFTAAACSLFTGVVMKFLREPIEEAVGILKEKSENLADQRGEEKKTADERKEERSPCQNPGKEQAGSPDSRGKAKEVSS